MRLWWPLVWRATWLRALETSAGLRVQLTLAQLGEKRERAEKMEFHARAIEAAASCAGWRDRALLAEAAGPTIADLEGRSDATHQDRLDSAPRVAPEDDPGSYDGGAGGLDLRAAEPSPPIASARTLSEEEREAMAEHTGHRPE